MAEKKDKLIEEHFGNPIKVGDYVNIPKELTRYHAKTPDEKMLMKVIDLNDNLIMVKSPSGMAYEGVIAVDRALVTKSTYGIGVNPFHIDGWRRVSRVVNFDIENIMLSLFDEYRTLGKYKPCEHIVNGMPVRRTNFNPFVIDKDGNKQYYQRDLCWSLEAKQMLIESIYHGLNCGQVVIRKRKYDDVVKAMKQGDTEICLHDIVDGKQRLNCIMDFMMDRFPDKNGNYFSDFSESAQHAFERSMSLSYLEMPEDTTDADVIDAFLNVNFAGIPQSKNHIEYVERIAKLLK